MAWGTRLALTTHECLAKAQELVIYHVHFHTPNSLAGCLPILSVLLTWSGAFQFLPGPQHTP